MLGKVVVGLVIKRASSPIKIWWASVSSVCEI